MNEFKNVDFWVHQQWKIAEIHWSYKGVEVKKKMPQTQMVIYLQLK